MLAVFWVKPSIMIQPPFCCLTGLNHWMLMLHNLTEPWRLPLTAAITLPLMGGSYGLSATNGAEARPRPAPAQRSFLKNRRLFRSAIIELAQVSRSFSNRPILWEVSPPWPVKALKAARSRLRRLAFILL